MPFSPQLTLTRRHTQPAAVYIARLSATAVFAYLLALHVPAGTSRPVLAPLTALLVLQASLFQTVRSGIKKVVSVTAGVIAAVGLSSFVGFNWWLLGFLIAGALVIGHVLRLGADMIEVPVSAMLIFSSAGTHAAAAGRVTDTLVGTAAGLAGGLVFAPLRTRPAREAVGDLGGRLAALLDRVAGDLGHEPDPPRVGGWLTAARNLRGEIERVDDTLRRAEDSARLNPRTLRLPGALPEAEVALRGGLETLERAALTLRFLVRSILDATRVDNEASPVRDAEIRKRLASVFTRLAAATRAYGELMRTVPVADESLQSVLAAELAGARELQDRLADLLDPRGVPHDATEWPLRGEILSHVDRLRTGLAADSVTGSLPRRPPGPAPRVLARPLVRRPPPGRRAGAHPAGQPRRASPAGASGDQPSIKNHHPRERER